jgi:hypothetical protein
MEEGNNRSDSLILKSISGLEKMEVLHLVRPAEEVQDMVNALVHNLLDVMPELQPAARASGSRARSCSMDLPARITSRQVAICHWGGDKETSRD